MTKYTASLTEVDEKSDTLRYSYENEFISKYGGKFLNNYIVAQNLLQAFTMLKKCIDKEIIIEEEKFDSSLKPEFFVWASHGIGNCYFRKGIWEEKIDKEKIDVTGYTEVIDFIYQNQEITNKDKLYPLIFMLRHTIEVCLKRLLKHFKESPKTHSIKELWEKVKPKILECAKKRDEDLTIIDIIDKIIDEINTVDEKGESFRYPTSYDLVYLFDNKKLCLNNVYTLLKGLINFLNGCNYMIEENIEWNDYGRLLDY